MYLFQPLSTILPNSSPLPLGLTSELAPCRIESMVCVCVCGGGGGGGGSSLGEEGVGEVEAWETERRLDLSSADTSLHLAV